MSFNRSDRRETNVKPFKERKSFATRREEVTNLKSKFPDKVFVVVERYSNEATLPYLDKTKYLVPEALTLSQFLIIIRRRLNLNKNQALYFIVNQKSLTCMTKTMGELYNHNKDDDGFLYITYASEDMFG